MRKRRWKATTTPRPTCVAAHAVALLVPRPARCVVEGQGMAEKQGAHGDGAGVGLRGIQKVDVSRGLRGASLGS